MNDTISKDASLYQLRVCGSDGGNQPYPMGHIEGLILVPPYSPTDIVGAKEVWDSGGRVYICPVVPGPDGEKYSTSALEAKLRQLKDRQDNICLDQSSTSPWRWPNCAHGEAYKTYCLSCMVKRRLAEVLEKKDASFSTDCQMY